METRKFFSKLMLPAVAAVLISFSSCIDKIEVPAIMVGSYSLHVVQHTTEEGVTEYLPYIGFWYDGKEQLDHGVITKDGLTMEFATNKELQVCQINPQDYKVTSLEELNGTYEVGPVGVNGNEWINKFELEFSGKETIGEFDITKFGYNRGKLYATFVKATNATSYGFYIQPYINGSITSYYAYVWPAEKIMTTPYNVVFEDEKTISLEFLFNPTDYAALEITRYRITPIACGLSTGGAWRLMCMASVYKDLDASQYLDEIVFYDSAKEEE